MTPRIGQVKFADQYVGTITQRPDGSTVFIYAPQWLNRPDAVAISQTLPLTPLAYKSPGLHPFFANLLPEGWLLDLTAKKLHLAPEDAFGLLLATCADCIGAVSVEPLGEQP